MELHGELMSYGLLATKSGALCFPLIGHIGLIRPIRLIRLYWTYSPHWTYLPPNTLFLSEVLSRPHFLIKKSSAPHFGAHNHYLCSVKSKNIMMSIIGYFELCAITLCFTHSTFISKCGSNRLSCRLYNTFAYLFKKCYLCSEMLDYAKTLAVANWI